MYWYSFNDTELKRARSQAETQGEYSDSVDRLKKEVGNLGEVAFWRWCQAYLPDETWEWHNETAWMNGEPETNSYDFDIQDANVDVKTTAQSTGHSARRWVHLIGNENNKWDIYVFVQLTANYEDAAVIGWARNQDLTDKARTQGASESPFDYFPVRDTHSIIPQLSIAQPE